MSTLATHAAVGLLLGVALRIPPRYLPVAAFIAASPDLDHLDMFLPVSFPSSRVTLHNIFYCVLVPVLSYAMARRYNVPSVWRRIAGASPLLLSSHLLLDMLPLEPLGARQRVALMYPVDRSWYTLPDIQARMMDPTSYSILTVILVLLAVFTLLTDAALRLIEDAPPRVARVRPAARIGAYASAWALVFPAFLAGGFLVSAPMHTKAEFSVEEARLLVPDGRFAATVVHLGGEPANAGSLVLEVRADGAVVATEGNPTALSSGDRWVAELRFPDDVRSKKSIQVRVLMDSALDPRLYASAPVAIKRSHLDLDLSVGALRIDALGKATVTVRNDGSNSVPASVLRVTVLQSGGEVVANVSNADPLPARGSWSVPVSAGLLSGSLSVIVQAVDDGHVYVRQSLEGVT